MTTSDREKKELVRELTAELNAGNVDAMEEYLVADYG